jgi:hypothetical protein
MKKDYKLSDVVDAGDIISVNINRNKTKLYYNIQNFGAQSINNGVYAENILRVLLDAVNLNQLHKNHPHVDIAIVNEIPGVAQKNEIISVKSSIKKSTKLSKVITDTKSIQLESMFSYILFADSNYELSYDKNYFKHKSLLNEGINKIKVSENKNWKQVVNLVAFYLMFKNKKEFELDFKSDLDVIANTPQNLFTGVNPVNLKHGTYGEYRLKVLRRLYWLDSPMSLGAIYGDTEGRVIIQKTSTIKLNRYWENLVDIWMTGRNGEDFFSKTSKSYLNLDEVGELFGIGEEFPIKITLSIGSFVPETETEPRSEIEKIKAAKLRSEVKTFKLWVATKYRDANFGNNEREVGDIILKSVDALQRDPGTIPKFKDFISQLK